MGGARAVEAAQSVQSHRRGSSVGGRGGVDVEERVGWSRAMRLKCQEQDSRNTCRCGMETGMLAGSLNLSTGQNWKVLFDFSLKQRQPQPEHTNYLFTCIMKLVYSFSQVYSIIYSLALPLFSSSFVAR